METIRSVCILGRQPALGLAELESLYGAGAVVPVAEHAAGLTLPASEVDFKRLGGSTRLARVIAVAPDQNWKNIEKRLAKELVDIARDLPEGKVQLGLSLFGITGVSPAKLTAAGLTLKKIIRGRTERSIRLIQNTELELSTASVLHNHLVGGTGVEALIIAANNGTTLLALTTEVQDIESYAERDRGRPKRDARVGMLPPKLAQIIINLATPGPHPSLMSSLHDPFCGTGVLLQEALLMELDVYGSDIEPRMIEYSQANLEWLDKKYGVRHGGNLDFSWNLEVADATTATLQTHHVPPKIERIACETYLGRPFTDRPSAEIIAQTVSEVNLILKKFLKNMTRQTDPGVRLCLAVPAWQTAPHTFRHLPLIDQISELGYNRIRFEHVEDSRLIYYREDQSVARELLVLTRK